MDYHMIGSWEIDNLPMPIQFVAFADAYLDSAARLRKVLSRSTRKRSYPRGAVVLFLTYHAVELFLKAAILHKYPAEGLHHNVEHLHNRYRILYPGKRYELDIPFTTECLGFEPSHIAEKKRMMPTQDKINRYPSNKKGESWDGIFGFEPDSFQLIIARLQNDFARLKSEIFTPKAVNGKRRNHKAGS
jgi:hypothetical protein